MDISALSNLSDSVGMLASSTARTGPQPADHGRSADHVHQRRHCGAGHGRCAMGAFRQELRLALEVRFHARFEATQANYAATQQAATADDVAAEALGAARQLVAEAPTAATESLISFRSTVRETASFVQETIGAQDDEIDDVVARVDEGLDGLENEVAANRESSASVLDVDTSTRQRSTIRIRTQEGDVVRFSLKRAESLSATDVATANAETSASFTEVEVSSRSRMMVRIEGDLNEAELAAIQNVFAQAEMIADEFFGGDIGAAFNLAEGFEFDTEQLSRVNMRFRMREVTNIAYAESVRATPIAPSDSPATAVPEPDSAPVLAEQIVSDEPFAAPTEIDVAEQHVAADQPENSPPEALALSRFFDALSTFLRSVGEGFETNTIGGGFSYHYAESFKLELLKAVFHTVAPDDAGEAAANAASAIDRVIEHEGNGTDSQQ